MIAAWRKDYAKLGALDFADEEVRKREAKSLMPRTRLDFAPKQKPVDERNLSSAAPKRAGFEYVQKAITGDLSLVGRLLTMSGGEHLTRPYEQSGWVYACITALASAVAAVPRRLLTKDPDRNPDNFEEVTSGPLHRLLIESPNQHQSADEFYRAGVTHRRLDGEDVWFLMRADGEPIDPGEIPAQVVPWRGSIVDILTDSRGFPAAYRWPWRMTGTASSAILDHASGAAQERSLLYRWFPAHSVVQFRDYDPNNPGRGLGAVEVLSQDLEREYQAGRYQGALLENAGDPGGWIITKRRVSPTGQKQAQERLDDETSNVLNRGRWKYIADEHASVVPNSMSPKDLEFGNLLTWTRDKTASVMGVPPIIIGVYDRATFRNFEAAIRQFYTGPNGVIPYLRTVESTLDSRLFGRLPGAESEYRFRFDIDAIEELQEDMTDKLAVAVKASEGGNELTLQAALNIFGITPPEDFAFGETVIVPGGVTTLDLIENPPEPEPSTPPASTDDEEGDDEKALGDSTRDVPQPDEINIPPKVDEQARLRAERRAYHAETLKTFRRGRALLIEKEYARRVAKYLRSYGRAQLAKIKSVAKTQRALPGDVQKSSFTLAEIAELISLPRDEWDAKLGKATYPGALDAFVSASDHMATALGAGSSSFVATDAAAIKFAETQTAQLVEGVNSRLAKKVTKLVQERLKAGATSASLRVAIGEVLPDLTPELRQAFTRPEQRAQAIARTETGKAVNGGRVETMKENGVERHEWSSSGDDAVRDSHVQTDGEVVKIGDSFSNGLHYPLEPNGPAGEVINCRCSTFPADV